MGFPLLQKPAETCVGRQIQVLGSYWTGRMSTEEANSLYKCTVCDFHALHKWDAGGTPSQAMELQEMGVDGLGSRETGGSSADRHLYEVPDVCLTTKNIKFALGASVYVETAWHGYTKSSRASVHHR